MIEKEKFTTILKKVYQYAGKLGLNIIDTKELDKYFKGDLDGINILISSDLDDEEELFNVLHLIGHSIQWNTSPELRQLGSVLHHKPNTELLRKLQEYEWQAACYSISILHIVNGSDEEMDVWLDEQYRSDMFYLTHYYKTGEKLKEITDIAKANEFTWRLDDLKIPKFTPYANLESRSGIVIDFDNQ